MQLDSDDENEPQNIAGRPPPDAEADLDALEDAEVDLKATAAWEGGAHTREASHPAKQSGPKMADGYQAWITASKAAWRAHRLANLQSSASGGAAIGLPDGSIAGLGQGLQRQMAAMMHATWHIVQVCKSFILDIGVSERHLNSAL